MFVKGQSGNPAGRREGTGNKVSQKIRESIVKHVDDYMGSSQFEEDLQELQPKDRIRVFIDLVGYVTPKLASATIDNHTAAKADFAEELRRLTEGN